MVEDKGITDMATTEDALEVVTAQLARLQEELSLKSEEVEGLTSQVRCYVMPNVVRARI